MLLILISLVALVIFFFSESLKEQAPVDDFPPETPDAEFSEQELLQLNNARNDFVESGGHDVRALADYFESSIDLTKNFSVCKQELVINSISCYRILAFTKQDQKEEICNQITPKLCSSFQNKKECQSEISNHQFECKLLLPFIK